MIQQALNELSQQIRIRPRYDNFIGGQWVAPVKGQYFTNLTPVTGKPLVRGRPLVRRGHRARARRRPQGQGHLGQDAARRARPPSEQDRRQDGEQSQAAGDGRDARQRQADPRDDRRRSAARRRSLPLFRELPPRPGRLDLPRSTTTRSPITSTSRSASSARSFPGTSRSSWRAGSSRRRSPPATA